MLAGRRWQGDHPDVDRIFGAGVAWFGDVLLANRRPLEIVAGVFIVFAGLVYARMPLPLTMLR